MLIAWLFWCWEGCWGGKLLDATRSIASVKSGLVLLLNGSNPRPAKWRHFAHFPFSFPLSNTHAHTHTQLFLAWWPPINKKSSHSQRRRGQDLKIKWTNLIVESARVARLELEGGKGKSRTEASEREREGNTAALCVWVYESFPVFVPSPTLWHCAASPVLWFLASINCSTASADVLRVTTACLLFPLKD